MSDVKLKYRSGIEHELELAAKMHRLYVGTIDELLLRAADEIARLRGENHE